MVLGTPGLKPETPLAAMIRIGDPGVVSDDEILIGIRRPGKFDATVASEVEARRLVLEALPDAVELPRAQADQPYGSPPPGVLRRYQSHPPEPEVGHDLPHLKYEDWTGGKKGRGGSWGHLFFPPADPDRAAH